MATAESQNCNVVHRLTGQNSKLRKLQLQAVERGHGLLQFVNGESARPAENHLEAEWLKNAGKTMATIVGSLDAEQAQLILVCLSAKEIWDKLLSVHEKKCEVSIMNLYEEYLALRMCENENVAGYVSKVTMLAAELEDQGEKLSDNI